MVMIQNTLTNFSVVKDILALFSGSEQEYKLSISADEIIHPVIPSCPRCQSKTSLNGYNTCTDRRAKMFNLQFKKGKSSVQTKAVTFHTVFDRLW